MLQLRISGDDYELCVKAAANMACSRKPGGIFERGCINTPSDKFKVERIGRLGEVALARYLRVKPDLEYHKDGDKEDFIYRGLSVDIKTASYNSGRGLIRAITQWGRYVPLNADVYIFAYLNKESRVEQTADLVYVGFLYQNEVLREPVPARIGKHWNFEVNHSELRPIEELVHEELFKISGRKNACC